MDNITHSLTGALAAKIIEASDSDSEKTPGAQRILFWLMVVCANLPDIDVILNFGRDQFYSIQHHRALTHSLLLAPVLSFLPAIISYLFSSYKNLKILWITALVGVYVHIFFDLITSFGTQLFAPLSATRYSLDWMFIVDPLFTVTIAVLLFLGRRSANHKPAFAVAGGIFVASYLALEIASHTIAYRTVHRLAHDYHLAPEKVSVLPQPLNIFRWMGLIQTPEGVEQTFFNAFDGSPPTAWTSYPHAHDAFVQKALQTHEAKLFFGFARHHWIQSVPLEHGHVVELRDQQFSFNPELVRALGVAEFRTPFVLRFYFSSAGEIDSVRFNR
jgi:inner membrane protein